MQIRIEGGIEEVRAILRELLLDVPDVVPLRAAINRDEGTALTVVEIPEGHEERAALIVAKAATL